MLCRPQDNVFFGKNLRTLVLDEAHLYTGVLATEITLLQRRLLLRCCLNSSDVLQFATSATLGKADDLKPFAAKLFSKDETSIQVIVGEQKKPALPPISKGQMHRWKTFVQVGGRRKKRCLVRRHWFIRLWTGYGTKSLFVYPNYPRIFFLLKTLREPKKPPAFYWGYAH